MIEMAGEQIVRWAGILGLGPYGGQILGGLIGMAIGSLLVIGIQWWLIKAGRYWTWPE